MNCRSYWFGVHVYLTNKYVHPLGKMILPQGLTAYIKSELGLIRKSFQIYTDWSLLVKNNKLILLIFNKWIVQAYPGI